MTRLFGHFAYGLKGAFSGMTIKRTIKQAYRSVFYRIIVSLLGDIHEESILNRPIAIWQPYSGAGTDRLGEGLLPGG